MKKSTWLLLCLWLAGCVPPMAGTGPLGTFQPTGRAFHASQPYLDVVFPAGYQQQAGPDASQPHRVVGSLGPRGAVVFITARKLQQAMDLGRLGEALVRVDQGELRAQPGAEDFRPARPDQLGGVSALAYTYSLAGRQHRRLLAESGGWLYAVDLSGPAEAQEELAGVLATVRLLPATPAACPTTAGGADTVMDETRPQLDSLDPPRLAQALARIVQARAAADTPKLSSLEAEAAALQVLVLRGQKRRPPALDLPRLLEQARAAGAAGDNGDRQRAWGLILLASDRAPEAEDALERAVKLEPGRAVNYLALALWYGFDASSQESYARRALALDPALVGAQWMLVRALELQNRNQEAESAIAGLLARDPQHSLGLQAAGGLEIDRAPEQALAHLEQALALDPQNTNARFNLALCLKRLHKDSQAESELDKLLAQDPQDASALDLRGRVQQEQGRLAQARQSFEAAIKANPQAAHAYYNLGALCAGQLADLACAKPAFSRFLELEPSGPRSQKIRDWLTRQGR